MPDAHFLQDLIILFGLGTCVVLFFHRANLPPIVGFLITGILCGPHSFSLISDPAEIHLLGEIGMILLLFTLGIELSLKKIIQLRHFLLTGGFGQVALTTLATAIVLSVAGFSLNISLFAGMLVALSSTALVIRYLSDRGEIDSLHGKTSTGILIFQDLIIIPMILMTPFLAGQEAVINDVILTLLKAIIFVVAAFALARYVVPWILHRVVRTRNREAFLMTIVLLCMGTAWVSAAMGLSLTLGAFIAGLVVSESEYSLQAISDIIPLREIFNSLFFISVGMICDPTILVGSPLLFVGLVAAVIILKLSVSTLVVAAHGYPLRAAMFTGLALAQIGEFSFILADVGRTNGLLSELHHSWFLTVTIGTMLMTPLLRSLWPRVANHFERLVPELWSRGTKSEFRSTDDSPLNGHVIIIGYGPNGRHIAETLGEFSIDYIVVEMNPKTVHFERSRNMPIIYGDAARIEILKKAGIDQARLIVLAIPDMTAARRSIHLARKLNPTIEIVVRSRFHHDRQDFIDLGANQVISQDFETSVSLFSKILDRYDIEPAALESYTDKFRTRST